VELIPYVVAGLIVGFVSAVIRAIWRSKGP
jgi:hypothetical protein